MLISKNFDTVHLEPSGLQWFVIGGEAATFVWSIIHNPENSLGFQELCGHKVKLELSLLLAPDDFNASCFKM